MRRLIQEELSKQLDGEEVFFSQGYNWFLCANVGQPWQKYMFFISSQTGLHHGSDPASPCKEVLSAVLDLRALQVKMATLADLDPLASLACLDRMEEKDPEDPWALKVRLQSVIGCMHMSLCLRSLRRSIPMSYMYGKYWVKASRKSLTVLQRLGREARI